MNAITAGTTSNSWVHIGKNNKETKKEMDDGIPEIIRERLSNERTEGKKNCSKIQVFSVAFGVAYLV
jgi:hypothetical protein